MSTGRSEALGFGVFCCGVTLGLVLPTLDANGKPQLAGICNQGNADITDTTTCPGGQMLTTQANFEEWYHDTPAVNLSYLVYLEFVKNGSVSTFEADGKSEYFPLDNAGWGNNATVNGVDIFNAERHLTNSDFRVDTNLSLSNCGSVPTGTAQ